MNSQDYSKNYADGFDGFRQALIDAFNQDDVYVMRLLAPIAEQIYNKKFPKMKGSGATESQQPKQKFTLQVLLDKINPIIETIWPSNIKEPYKTTLTEMTFEESIETAKEVAGNISSQVLLKLGELEQAKRIHAGRSEEECLIEVKEKSIRDNLHEIEKTKKELEQVKASGTDQWRIRSFEIHIEVLIESNERIRQEIQQLKERIAQGQATQEDTCYRRYTDTVEVAPEYTAEDAISIIHEIGHAATRGYLETDGEKDTLLNELPSITAEFLADKQLAKMSLGDEHRAVNRVVDMQRFDAKTIVLLNQVFDEYEQTGTISHAIVDKALYKSYELDGSNGHKKPEDYTQYDVNHFRNMIQSTRYFIGTAGALALRQTVKNKEDLDKVFDILNNTNLTDAQRLVQMGITQENIVISLNNFIQQNREQTVDKMRHPWDKIN